ncbi:hypothetical protein [Microbacterium sp. SORGH_AS_0888]|uniref:hypothetical protein n=1 Tax=Microbacterium sp. SORGH_AS_0888 TaxID=3041791 RepID=UPI00278B7F46|nr:hypothetical protein [Microbacterium sp. SORGH_AS_0888]MDQ1130252.1 hypothetical protein [Microbacterium sp. SORGH_AS_0888]
MSESEAAVPEVDASKPPLRDRTVRLTTVAIAVAVALVVGVGASVGTLLPMVIGQGNQIAALASDVDQAKKDQATEGSRRANAEAALASAKQDIAKREADVAAREAAVKKTEQQVAANSFGEGIRLVGKNTAPGVYTTGTITSGRCYYVWKTSTASDADIVDNNIVKSGTATVTLRDGEVFSSNSCGTWTKQD